MQRILSNDSVMTMSKEILYKLSDVTFHSSLNCNGNKNTQHIVTSKATFGLFNDLLIFYNNI